MIEIHESRQDGVGKATYRTGRNFERENIEDQTANEDNSGEPPDERSPQSGEALGGPGPLTGSRHWDGNLQVRLVFRLVERHPGPTPSTRTTVMVVSLLLVPPLLGRLQGVSELWIESGGR